MTRVTTVRLPHPSGISCDCGRRATLRITVDDTSRDVCRPCRAELRLVDTAQQAEEVSK
jgi:hypothetical protein